MRRLERIGPPDLYLLAITLVLVAIGIWLVYDASYPRMAEASWANNDPRFEAKRQLVYALIGIVLMLIASRLRLQTLLKITLPLLLVSFGLLVAVMVVGVEINGAKRWLEFGPVRFQPSEIAKLALVLYLAGVIAQRKLKVQRLTVGRVSPACVVGIITALIFIEPDMGTALTVVFTCFVMLFVGGVRISHLFGLASFGALMCMLAVKLEPYRMERIRTWLNPWRDPYNEGYQVIHSLIALGTGGIFGQGLCEGREKHYTPAASTDFIFATLGEELGLFGGLALLTLFVIFTFRALMVARRCKSTYGNLVITGIASTISLQALVNVAVVSASIPATGVPLPFISYGGSSLVSMLIGVGILLAVTGQTNVVVDDKELYENSFDGWRDGRTHISRSQRRRSTSSGSRRGPVVRRQLSRTGRSYSR